MSDDTADRIAEWAQIFLVGLAVALGIIFAAAAIRAGLRVDDLTAELRDVQETMREEREQRGRLEELIIAFLEAETDRQREEVVDDFREEVEARDGRPPSGQSSAPPDDAASPSPPPPTSPAPEPTPSPSPSPSPEPTPEQPPDAPQLPDVPDATDLCPPVCVLVLTVIF